ncbi:DUF6273 domain-containing protein [Butyrivibrio sp. AE2015]|uniref:DUF6273 domain-containing protein n=1 Tax=Butyrivibrio sp. AE2015 TaxID=1280663 RepID=UPI0003B7AC2F|nr:DUF6273 domain-containing protein [Butyrivibrio sp. AE2015]
MNRKWRALIIFLVFAMAVTGCGGHSSKKGKSKSSGAGTLTDIVGTEKLKPDIASEPYDGNNYKDYFPNAISFAEFAGYFDEVEINMDNWSDYFEVREEQDPESDYEHLLYVFAPKNDNVISSVEDEVRFCVNYSISDLRNISDPDTGSVIRSEIADEDRYRNHRIESCKEILGNKYINYGRSEYDDEPCIVEDIYTLDEFTVYDAQGTIYEMDIPEDVWIEKTNKDGQTIRYIDMTDGIVMRRLYENGFVHESSLFKSDYQWESSDLNGMETNMNFMDMPLSERISDCLDIDKFKHSVSIDERLAIEKIKDEQYTSLTFMPADVFYNCITKTEIDETNYDEYIEEYVEYVDDSAVVTLEIKDGYFIGSGWCDIKVFYENKPNDGSAGNGEKEVHKDSVYFDFSRLGPKEVKNKIRVGNVITPDKNNHVEVLDIHTSIDEVYSFSVPEEYINKDYLSVFEYGYVREYILLGTTEASLTLYLDDMEEISYIISNEDTPIEYYCSDSNINAYGTYRPNLNSKDYMEKYVFDSYDGDTQIPMLEEGKVSDNLKNAKNGEIYLFGEYEQNGIAEDGKEPIEWIVCDKKDGYALLLSRYILESGNSYSQYQGIEPEDRTWKNSLQRYFLNEYFYNVAFNDEEKNQIASVNNDSSDCDAYFVRNGSDNGTFYDETITTVDRVFELSAIEWNSVATELQDKCFTYPTEHACTDHNNYNPSDKYSDEFALRNRAGLGKSDSLENAEIIMYQGMVPVTTDKNSVYLDTYGSNYFIRPAIWVKY